MLRSESRILTTHTGSLPRPDALREYYVARQTGKAGSEDELKRLSDDAVRAAIGRQVEAGIDIGNDGEQAREGFFIYLLRRLSGFGGGWDRPLWKDMEEYPRFRAQRDAERRHRSAVTARDLVPEAIGEVRYLSPEPIQQDCANFADTLRQTGNPFIKPFMTAPSPGLLSKAMRNRHYDTERAYLAALAEALRVEYETIVASGFLLQVDCPDLALERHAAYKDQPLSAFLGFVEAAVEVLNAALVNIPREKVRIHVCWGNYEGPHDHDVELKAILPLLLKANVGGYVLPFANGRHGQDFKAFAQFPLADDQVLVAGVIDTLVNVVEHPEVIADRIVRVASVIGDPTRVMAGTDCGFDTAAGSGRVADDVVWAKLRSIRQGADIASRQLFAN